MASKVKVILRNAQEPSSLRKTMDYTIDVIDHELGRDWITALKNLLNNQYMLEKNFCFLGWPRADRDVAFLCEELNKYIALINNSDVQVNWVYYGMEPHVIEEYFSEEAVRFPYETDGGYTEQVKAAGKDPSLYLSLAMKHSIMNRLHNHFEVLQGTVDNLSKYYLRATTEVQYAIRQLNLLCHEMESLMLTDRKVAHDPEWVRPSQITSFLNAPRLFLKESHKVLFAANSYDRTLGGVYTHWCQLGKTYMEVWRDEDGPLLSNTTCEAITMLEYYSGEFDIEWGKSITRKDPWFARQLEAFNSWMLWNRLVPHPEQYSLGYLPLGQVDLQGSFGTEDHLEIIDIMKPYLDIYAIEVDGVRAEFPYSLNDSDWKEAQQRALTQHH